MRINENFVRIDQKTPVAIAVSMQQEVDPPLLTREDVLGRENMSVWMGQEQIPRPVRRTVVDDEETADSQLGIVFKDEGQAGFFISHHEKKPDFPGVGRNGIPIDPLEPPGGFSAPSTSFETVPKPTQFKPKPERVFLSQRVQRLFRRGIGERISPQFRLRRIEDEFKKCSLFLLICSSNCGESIEPSKRRCH